ncbi:MULTISPECIES: hypothetical protein [Enterococcus]|uniref:hypothetical protein n=1 Tax=Enterococcus TaxID=1350 RepID=UPI000B6E2174|nr:MULTISPECIES: hypothetical protein [Enterococcus]OTO21070.1 hypothetical protein A5875_002442 [Enterococcus sp. 3H8_DIV0648]
MKKRFLGKLVVGLGVLLGVGGVALANTTEADAADMYRLYNPNSGEHFYTANLTEKNKVQSAGWRYEGIGWYAPNSGDPVYRLYNPNAGDHHYTVHLFEKNHLVSVGWRYEGIGWYSDTKKSVPLYRAYNPNAKAGSHNYTVNNNEQQILLRAGWRNEGIAWYGVNKTTTPVPKSKWTVWLTVDKGQDTKYNVVSGKNMFDTREAATTWIDDYAAKLPFGVSVASYGTIEVPQ